MEFGAASSRILPRIPVARPYKCVAPPLCTTLLLAAGTQRTVAHPERTTTIDTWFLSKHGFTRLIVLAFGRYRPGEELAPGFLGLK